MIHRSKHLSVYVILIGTLLFSLGFNIVQHKRIKSLEHLSGNSWVTDVEYQKIKQEIERLEKNPFGVR
jgi:hypothetical protein